MNYIADLFIDGQWRPGGDGTRFDVIDPSDLSVIARYAAANEADCMAAVDAASAAQEGWAATPARVRSELLRAVYDVLTDEVEVFAELMVRENGKS
jgi:succinate-semialdehyde dehydrogenase/glutarate-semialdehyde dehydrogenase